MIRIWRFRRVKVIVTNLLFIPIGKQLLVPMVVKPVVDVDVIKLVEHDEYKQAI